LAQKVVIIGIGMAGTAHARAMEDVPGVALIAGIDTRPRSLIFRGGEVPIYQSVFDMWSEKKLHPDVIVVATPTPTHAQVCGEVTEYYRHVSIIVEKPAADNLQDAQRIICDIGDKQRVAVAYHMAFSPVIEWAFREAAERAGELGPPTAIESWGTDPYQSELASAQARLGNSWIDSGINALSVIERFVKPVKCTSLRQIGHSSRSVFEGTFICEADGRQLPATILTSWYSTAPSRWIRIRYSSGAELVMDHNAVAGYIRQNGEACAVFGSDGTTPRREAHYRALYKSWLAEQDQIFSTDTSARLHALLLANIS
jgi:predicted dehydrogenase